MPQINKNKQVKNITLALGALGATTITTVVSASADSTTSSQSVSSQTSTSAVQSSQNASQANLSSLNASVQSQTNASQVASQAPNTNSQSATSNVSQTTSDSDSIIRNNETYYTDTGYFHTLSEVANWLNIQTSQTDTNKNLNSTVNNQTALSNLNSQYSQSATSQATSQTPTSTSAVTPATITPAQIAALQAKYVPTSASTGVITQSSGDLNSSDMPVATTTPVAGVTSTSSSQNADSTTSNAATSTASTAISTVSSQNSTSEASSQAATQTLSSAMSQAVNSSTSPANGNVVATRVDQSVSSYQNSDGTYTVNQTVYVDPKLYGTVQSAMNDWAGALKSQGINLVTNLTTDKNVLKTGAQLAVLDANDNTDRLDSNGIDLTGLGGLTTPTAFAASGQNLKYNADDSFDSASDFLNTGTVIQLNTQSLDNLATRNAQLGGNIITDVLKHEIGHYFGLVHVTGDSLMTGSSLDDSFNGTISNDDAGKAATYLKGRIKS